MYPRVVLRDFRRAFGREVRNFIVVSPENSRRMRGAAGTAAAAVTAVLLADWLNLDNPWWAGITTLVVSRAAYGASLAKGVLRVIGTIAGCVLALPLVGMCLDNTFAMLSLIFFAASGTVVVTFYRGRDSYAWSMAGFIIVLISLTALNISAEVVFHFAVYRAIEISLGTVTAVTMSAIFNPVVSAQEAAETMGRVWAGLADALRLGARGWADGGVDAEAVRDLRRRLDRDLEALPGLIFESRVEGELKPEQVAMASRLNRLAGQLSRRLFLVLEGRPVLSEGYVGRFRDELENAAGCLDALSGAVGRILKTTEGAAGAREAAEGLHAALEAVNARHSTFVQDRENAGRTAGEMLAWGELRHVLGDFSSALGMFARRESEPDDHEGKRPVQENMVVRQALGLGLTTILIPAIWNWCDFPGMLQIGVTSIVLLQPDPVESRRKGLLRLIGCTAGGGLGLLLLGTPVPQYLVSWAAVYCICIFLFSYLDHGDSRCSYVGLQAGIAMTVTMVQGAGPGTTLEPPLTRLCGILAAFTLWNIIHTLQGGFDPLSDLRRNLDEFSRFIAEMLGHAENEPETDLEIGDAVRKTRSAEAILRLRTAHRDLDVLIWEGSRTAEDNAFLQELLVRADRVLMEAGRAVRIPESPEARAVTSDSRLHLVRLRARTAAVLAEAHERKVSPLPELRIVLADAAADFEHDAAETKKRFDADRPSQHVLMEIAEVFMSLRGMFEAMAWIADNEPRIREIFGDGYPPAPDAAGAAASSS